MNMALARLIAGQIFLHACMTGMRMAAPLLARSRCSCPYRDVDVHVLDARLTHVAA